MTITINPAPQKWSRTRRYYPLPTCLALIIEVPGKSAVSNYQFNFLRCICRVWWDEWWLDGEMWLKWSRRSRPPLLQCNWLCLNHFHRSQWVNWHVSNESNYLLLRSSQFHVLLKRGIEYKAYHWKKSSRTHPTHPREDCWVCVVTGTSFACASSDKRE